MKQLVWYSRDASFWDHPDVWSLKKLHLERGNSKAAMCSSMIWLDTVAGAWHEEPDVGLRCKRCEAFRVREASRAGAALREA